jgi:ribose transport system substrate-binding protein
MRKKSRFIVPIFCTFILLVGAFLSGCQSADSAEQDDGQVTIGVTLLTREHVFFNMIEQALLDEAASLGYELIVMDGNFDTNTQTSQVQDFITQGVDAIIIAPANSAGIKNATTLANDAGIPVFTIDTAADGEVVSHIATDNYEGGKMAAAYLAELIDGEGEVGIITYSEIESCVNREDGFTEVIESEYPDITIVDVANCSGSAERAAALTQDMLLKYPDLKAIFAVGDPFAIGALSSIESAQRDVLLVGFDGNPEGVEEIKEDGLWKADIAQNPTAIAEMVLTVIQAHLAGEAVEPLIYIPPYVIDINNAE